MPLTLRKRHTAKCRKDNGLTEYSEYRRCACPIHAVGTLQIDGFVRTSTGEVKWDLAETVKRQWEMAGTIKAPVERSPEAGPDPTTLAVAIAEFRVGYIQAKMLREGTARKYRTVLAQLTKFADEKGYRFVNEFGLAEFQAFQASWHMGARAAGKKLEHTRTFMEFCVDRGFVPSNPARKLHAPTPKVTQKEPFSEAEMQSILVTARQYPSQRGASEAPKAHALILLMRYSGLRISDALSFSPEKLDSNRAFLYAMKTGDPVYVLLPEFVVSELNALPLVQGKYFWTGPGAESLEIVSRCWQRKLARVFKASGPFTSKPHPHRFRHTFACALLQKGVAVDDVAILLGHSNPSITLRHYSRWVKSRQDRLDNILRDVWETEKTEMKLIEGGRRGKGKRPAKLSTKQA